jgi:hypothetical protein
LNEDPGGHETVLAHCLVVGLKAVFCGQAIHIDELTSKMGVGLKQFEQ